MSKAKAKMTSKIISDYQSKIAEYIKKNEEISNEILDLKNSIDINDSILSQMMSETNLRSSNIVDQLALYVRLAHICQPSSIKNFDRGSLMELKFK